MNYEEELKKIEWKLANLNKITPKEMWVEMPCN